MDVSHIFNELLFIFALADLEYVIQSIVSG